MHCKVTVVFSLKFTNKESLRVALLSFCIAADEGTEGKKGSEILFLQRPRRNKVQIIYSK